LKKSYSAVIYPYLGNSNLLSGYQFGFRPNSSTGLAVEIAYMRSDHQTPVCGCKCQHSSKYAVA